MLLVAGMDRLDTELTAAHMQGRRVFRGIVKLYSVRCAWKFKVGLITFSYSPLWYSRFEKVT